MFTPHCVVSQPCCQKNRHQVWRLEVKKLKILAVLHLSFWRSLDFCFVPLGGDGCECLFLALLKGEICWFTHAVHIRTFLSKWDLLKSPHFFNSHLTLFHDPSLTLQSLPFSTAADLRLCYLLWVFSFSMSSTLAESLKMLVVVPRSWVSWADSIYKRNPCEV